MLPPLSKLSQQIAKEQDGHLLDLHLSEFAILRDGGRSVGLLRRRWLLAVVFFLVGVVAVTALVHGYNAAFSRLTYQVQPISHTPGVTLSARSEGQAGRWVVAREGQTSVITFSDGSKLWLQSGGRLRVVELGRTRADLALEQGMAQVRVEGTRLTEYHLWVGPFELTLPKGSAQATWDPMTLQLDLVVQEGYVIIAGCQFGQGRSVTAGKELGTRCSEP